ncbi:MAG: hypothetical protein Q4C58_04070 [Eubacteriales bacterium]|nr:hypothetical protein [Eubacteriales bacterium]
MRTQSYEIKNYGKKPTFASFLPGISGMHGIPIWCYYVNRGQGVVSFGVENKDKAIMEFYPAHEAYQNVKRTGFRTFLKKDGKFAEAFADEAVAHSMRIYKNSLELAEENEETGLKTEVVYFTLPEEKVGALVRCVTVTNTGDQPAEVEILDGMPAVIPYGVDMDSCKNMRQTAKAWMQVEQTAEGISYYRVRASMADSASVKTIEGGNFSYACLADGTQLTTIGDPEAVFGYDNSLGRPVNFAEGGLAGVQNWPVMCQNQVPSSFYGVKKVLDAGAAITIYEMIGQVENQEILSTFAKRKPDAAYFAQKRDRADELTEEIGNYMAGKTADPVFDEYSRYTFLDNVLRGGLPVQLGENKVFYVYSRKHGDLERDYNFFAMLPEFYSQGNGNFRDVNQNRRCDDFFAPFVGDFNIKTFYSLLQPDGYNPLGVEKITYQLKKEDGEKITFTPGSLYHSLMERTDLDDAGREKLFNETLTKAEPLVNGRFIEGYWTDHWTYNLDLVENYLKIFPEKEEELLFEDSYTWFRPQAGVLARRKRYAKTGKGIRQYSSVEEGLEAKEGCENDLLVCDQHGKGRVIRATLLEKLVLLSLTKFAALDAYGMGIEMEGGKPGWYDALNGLPGLLGSSVTELCELSRNLEFTIAMLQKYQKDVPVLEEAAVFYENVSGIVKECGQEVRAEGEAVDFWNRINDAKEAYREKIYYGVSGKKESLDQKELTQTLKECLEIVNCGIDKAVKAGDGVCPAYFYYEVTEFSEDEEGIYPIHFRQHQTPLFLEGAVRFLKLPRTGAEKKALYTKVRESELFDQKLSMYKVNAPLSDSSFELGRARAFTPGWLENESIWLHMEYKYLLELLKSGMYEEYFADFHQMAVPFLDPEVYGRSVYENSSFLGSSANPDPRTHGRGFVARLSGSTAEFIQMWTLMMFGQAPFVSENGELTLNLQPILPSWLIGENCRVEAAFLGKISVIYRFAEKKDYVPGSYRTQNITLRYADGASADYADGKVCGAAAEDVRNGLVKEIEVTIV